MSFLFEPFFGVVDLQSSTVRALGGWDNKVTVTAPDDIGLLTAKIVFAEPPVKGVVYTAGDTVTYRELAEVLKEVFERPFSRELWDMTRLKEELARDPGNDVKKYRVVFGAGTGVSWDRKVAFNEQRGIATVSVRGWAEKLKKQLEVV
jgi:hypothetical protein